jgi:hypothetical protein
MSVAVQPGTRTPRLKISWFSLVFSDRCITLHEHFKRRNPDIDISGRSIESHSPEFQYSAIVTGRLSGNNIYMVVPAAFQETWLISDPTDEGRWNVVTFLT